MLNGNMENIIDSSYVSVAYDRESDSIIAVWKQSGDSNLLKKIIASIEVGFSKYNAKNIINDITLFPSCQPENFVELLKDLIRIGLKKLAFIVNDTPDLSGLNSIGLLGGCEVKKCPCLDTAHDWVMTKNGHLF